MKLLTIALVSGLAAAVPVPDTTPNDDKSLLARGTFCGLWDSETAGSYTVYNNLWGHDSGSGSQCTTNNGVSGGALSWSTAWSWSGGPYSVKSYANAVVSFSKRSLGSISRIPTTWNWSYSGNNIIANVAYDLFTSSSAGGSAEYEFMIWLGAFGGAGPISSSGSPIATPNIAGSSWKLYKGPNGQMTVFSFVASSNIQNFNADLTDFTEYLINNHGVSRNQILQSVGAGTEPFTGSNAKLTTSRYSASVQ